MNQGNHQRMAFARIRNLEHEGEDAYPHHFRRTHTIEQVRSEFESLATKNPSEDHVSIAGRVRGIRGQGGLIFADIQGQLTTIQACIRRDVDERVHRLTHGIRDLGHHHWDRGKAIPHQDG